MYLMLYHVGQNHFEKISYPLNIDGWMINFLFEVVPFQGDIRSFSRGVSHGVMPKGGQGGPYQL